MQVAFCADSDESMYGRARAFGVASNRVRRLFSPLNVPSARDVIALLDKSLYPQRGTHKHKNKTAKKIKRRTNC